MVSPWEGQARARPEYCGGFRWCQRGCHCRAPAIHRTPTVPRRAPTASRARSASTERAARWPRPRRSSGRFRSSHSRTSFRNASCWAVNSKSMGNSSFLDLPRTAGPDRGRPRARGAENPMTAHALTWRNRASKRCGTVPIRGPPPRIDQRRRIGEAITDLYHSLSSEAGSSSPNRGALGGLGASRSAPAPLGRAERWGAWGHRGAPRLRWGAPSVGGLGGPFRGPPSSRVSGSRVRRVGAAPRAGTGAIAR
jgi:hypothetical protein